MTTPTLWHNMSSPPGTTIAYEADYAHDPFRYVVVEPRPKPESRTPSGILEVLDGKPWTGTDKQARTELRRRVNEHARALPLPPAVLTSDRIASPTHYYPDLLTAVTLCTKAGRGVYLRDKEPNLSALDSLVIILHLPPGVPALGKDIRDNDPR